MKKKMKKKRMGKNLVDKIADARISLIPIKRFWVPEISSVIFSVR